MNSGAEHRRPATGFTLSVFSRELAERANRMRTYGLRLAFLAALSIAFLIAAIQASGGISTGIALGAGGIVFQVLMGLQFVAVYLLITASLAGAITLERENGSLELLLLSGLTPWEVILQKYFSALCAGIGFLFIGLPFGALAYSLGGITGSSVITGGIALIVAALQAGAIALLASFLARSTLVALTAAYVLQAAPFLMGIWAGNPVILFLRYRDDLNAFLERIPVGLIVPATCLVIARMLWHRATAAAITNTADSIHSSQEPGANVVKRTGRQRKRRLPGKGPVAWRARRRLHKWLFGGGWIWLALIEVIVFSLCLASLLLKDSEAIRFLSLLHLTLWVLVWLIVTVFGVYLFVSEKTTQTLDILRMTPMSSWDILNQKTDSIREILAIAFVPIFTVALFAGQRSGMWIAGGFLFASASTLVFILLTFWVAVAVGLLIESRYKAILYALTASAACWLIPCNPLYISLFGNGLENSLLGLIQFVWGSFMLALFNAILFWSVYTACIAHADQLLGRTRVVHEKGNWLDLEIEQMKNFPI